VAFSLSRTIAEERIAETMDLNRLTVASALEDLRAGRYTASDLARAALARIASQDPEMHAFITVTGALALEQAAQADRAYAEMGGSPFPALLGIPIALKDLIDLAGHPTTAGTRGLGREQVSEDAEVVRRLKQDGATLVGKTNTHEIALGVTGVNPHFGAVRNPRDPACISGGSSSGSAAAVAAGMCLAALGTDTGGSVRIPASLCGVAGLKPTFGRISLRGVVPLSYNLDHLGILARTVADLTLLYRVLAAYDPADPGSADMPVELPGDGTDLSGWKIGWVRGEYVESAEAEILEGVCSAIDVFRDQGASVEDIDGSWLADLALANGRMTQADAAAYHAARLAEHPERFGADVRQRLETGAALPLAEYNHARRTQQEGRRRMELFFGQYDLMLLPTTPIPAPPIADTAPLDAARQLTRFTAPFNLTGVPALSVPLGRTGRGLPFGIQLVSGPWREAKVLQGGRVLETAILPADRQ
jgi:aspartyl-tRNA(Asn)/glutamyl-tRNA(Gln) amidotransferase subunit A